MANLKKYISEIIDYPKEGVVFKDLNPIYKEPYIWQEFMIPIQNLVTDTNPDYIVGIESRGFITASAIAFKNNIGFIAIRKPNKLPGDVIGINYKLEYGNDRLELQKNLFQRNSKVLIIDDLLATGGTASAAGKLIGEAGGNVIGYGFLVELTELNGRNQLDKNVLVKSVVKY